MIGLDDNNTEKLHIIPRIFEGTDCISAEGYTVRNGNADVKIDFCYKRKKGGYSMSLKADKPVFVESVRMGPYNDEQVKKFSCKFPYKIKEIEENRYVYVTVSNNVTELNI